MNGDTITNHISNDEWDKLTPNFETKVNFFNDTKTAVVEEDKEEIVSVDVNKEIAEFPLEPYPGRLYVIEDDVVKSHGLFVPDTSRKEGEMQTNKGYVVAVGADIGFVKPGDRIFYGQYSGACSRSL